MIGLILNSVHLTMFSLNTIGLEKKSLNEIVQSENKIFFHFNVFILSLQENELSYRKDFDIIRCVFKLCILSPNFNFLLKSVFSQLFQCCISQSNHEIKGSFLDHNNAYYVVYHMCKNIVVIKMFNVSKH